MRRARMLVLMLTALVALVAASSALAASPDEIADDLADNGVLDGRYTQAELDAYRRDPTQAIYPVVSGTEGTNVSGTLGTEAKGDSSLPFTGADIGLFALVGVGLVGSGLLVRRSSRERT